MKKDKFSNIEKRYWLSEIQNNKKFFIIDCLLIGAMEIMMLAIYFVANASDQIPSIDASYYPIYVIGIMLAAIFVVIIYNMKKQSRAVQILCLSCMLIWACMFSINDMKHGYHSYALAEILILSAASIRFPTKIHFAINLSAYLMYILFMIPLGLDYKEFLFNIFNTAILFFFTSFITIFINQTRLQNFSNQIIVEKQQKQLLHMTQYDELTQLYSRSLIFKSLETAMENSDHIGCIMTDIDDFKKYNDLYGHQIGDEVLYQTAKRVQEVIDKYDGHAGRYGGEEFLLFIEHCDAKKLRSLLEELQEAFNHTNDKRSITISMGGTIYKKDETIDALISRADQAMYRAKNDGKHTFRIN